MRPASSGTGSTTSRRRRSPGSGSGTIWENTTSSSARISSVALSAPKPWNSTTAVTVPSGRGASGTANEEMPPLTRSAPNPSKSTCRGSASSAARTATRSSKRRSESTRTARAPASAARSSAGARRVRVCPGPSSAPSAAVSAPKVTRAHPSFSSAAALARAPSQALWPSTCAAMLSEASSRTHRGALAAVPASGILGSKSSATITTSARARKDARPRDMRTGSSTLRYTQKE